MIVGLSFHEFSHAAVADRLGDHTARRFGRLTLNPRAHIDPTGALMVAQTAGPDAVVALRPRARYTPGSTRFGETP